MRFIAFSCSVVAMIMFVVYAYEGNAHGMLVMLMCAVSCAANVVTFFIHDRIEERVEFLSDKLMELMDITDQVINIIKREPEDTLK